MLVFLIGHVLCQLQHFAKSALISFKQQISPNIFLYPKGTWPLQVDISILPEAIPVYVLKTEIITPDQPSNGALSFGRHRSVSLNCRLLRGMHFTILVLKNYLCRNRHHHHNATCFLFPREFPEFVLVKNMYIINKLFLVVLA